MNLNYRLRLAVFAFVCLGFCNCTQKKQAESDPQISVIRNVSVVDAKAMLDKDSKIIVIDVRTREEYTGPLGHITDSKLKPVQQIENWVSEIDNLKEKDIMLICRSGRRSLRAANFLKERGFQNVINIEGGMIAWNENRFPVEK